MSTQHPLPPAEQAREWLETMLLIRRFEERAAEMYAKAKIGGFMHLCIGEEATIVGAVRALKDDDYLISTYREHGQALARGMDPGAAMAELFGREDGCVEGRGGSMHLFDADRHFMGGYGIVGGNLPLAAGLALSSKYQQQIQVTLCMFGDGASNNGTFGESLNFAALWQLPVVFMVINNQFGMGTALDRHAAVTELWRRGEGYGVPGVRCDGMDILDVHHTVRRAVESARRGQPVLVEAVTYRFRGHSMSDPEEYRSKEEVEQWQKRDPLVTFPKLLLGQGLITQQQLDEIERRVGETVERAVEFAEASPHPDPRDLYRHLYQPTGQQPAVPDLRPAGGRKQRADVVPMPDPTPPPAPLDDPQAFIHPDDLTTPPPVDARELEDELDAGVAKEGH